MWPRGGAEGEVGGRVGRLEAVGLRYWRLRVEGWVRGGVRE